MITRTQKWLGWSVFGLTSASVLSFYPFALGAMVQLGLLSLAAIALGILLSNGSKE